MAENSKIEWTDATWNPITGCSVVSPGCTNCYAMKLAGTRLKHHPSRQGLTTDTKAGSVWNGQVRFNEQWLTQPIEWKKPRRIFVCAHGDLFHENVPDEWIDQVFAVMAMSPDHTFQVLTKRSRRMREYFAARRNGDPWAEAADAVADALEMEGHPIVIEPRDIPLSNVWLGVSAEDQTRADERIPDLLATPAGKRFLSCEPLLGPIDLTELRPGLLDMRGSALRVDAFEGREYHEDDGGQWTSAGGVIHWVITGGESGPNARPMHPDWARSLRDQCQGAGVPFFFKQWGEWLPWCQATIDQRDMSNANKLQKSIVECKRGVGMHPTLRVGKKAAGAMLDGREWREMPE